MPWKQFLPSNSSLILLWSLTPFVCLFSNWSSLCFKFSIIALILIWSFILWYVLQASFSFKILIFSWVMEILEKVLEFSSKPDLVFPHQSLTENWLLFSVFSKKSKFCLEILKTKFGVFPPVTCRRVVAFLLSLIKKLILYWNCKNKICCISTNHLVRSGCLFVCFFLIMEEKLL